MSIVAQTYPDSVFMFQTVDRRLTVLASTEHLSSESGDTTVHAGCPWRANVISR